MEGTRLKILLDIQDIRDVQGKMIMHNEHQVSQTSPKNNISHSYTVNLQKSTILPLESVSKI
jgi:hypothetical protein